MPNKSQDGYFGRLYNKPKLQPVFTQQWNYKISVQRHCGAFIVNFEQISHISIVDLEQAKAGEYKTKLKTKTLEKRAGYFVESDQS